MKKKIIIRGGYLLVAAFTYGYAFNDELKFRTESSPQFVASNRGLAQINGFVCAAVWPIYWPFHASKAMWSKLQPAS